MVTEGELLRHVLEKACRNASLSRPSMHRD
jgi:hypothetical protein